MNRARKEIEESFISMLSRVWPLVLYVCRSRLGDSDDDVEDYLQNIKIRLWRAFVSIDGDMNQLRCKESTFVYVIADNLAKSYIKKRQKRSAVTKQRTDFPDNSLRHSTYKDDAERDDREYLYQLINILQAKDKDVIIMNIEGYSDDEIANKMGVSVDAVRMRLFRVKKKLKILSKKNNY